jgi:hypothetical protein
VDFNPSLNQLEFRPLKFALKDIAIRDTEYGFIVLISDVATNLRRDKTKEG